MFEIFGIFARPVPSLAPAGLAVWPLLVAIAILVSPGARARRYLIAGSTAGAVASIAALVFVLVSGDRMLLTSLGVAARVGQLELSLGLVIEPPSALLAAAAFGYVAWRAARTQASARSSSFGARRRAALGALTLSATLVAILADGAATLVLGAALTSLLGLVSGRASATAFATDRVADVALLASACVAFWLFGGSWIDGAYVPDLQPRLVIASSAGTSHPSAALFDEDEDERPRPASPAQSPASLSLGSLPRAAVMVDGTWLRSGDALLRAPFAGASVPAGSHTLRLHVGPGSDDFYVPRVQLGGGEQLALMVQGSTATFREMTDQLAAQDASGAPVARLALARRTMAPGVAAAGVVLVLALLAFAARLRLWPFDRAPGDRAPLAAFAALTIAWRFGVFAPLAPMTAAVATGALFVVALLHGSLALREGARAWTSAELAFAGAGVIAGAPSAALAHGCVAVFLGADGSRVPRPSHLALLFTRASILGACGALEHGSMLVVALGLGAALALSSPPAEPSRRWLWAPAIAVAIVAIDPRTLLHPRPSLLDQAFGKSVLPPSLALVVLLAAVTAFAVAASRRTAARLALPVSSAFTHAPSAATGAVTLAAASAVTELDSRFVDGFVQLGEAVLRAIAWLSSRLDAALVARSAFELPLPSERVTRALVVCLALLTLAAFSLPWLA